MNIEAQYADIVGAYAPVNKGMLNAPGTCAWLYSQGERTSMITAFSSSSRARFSESVKIGVAQRLNTKQQLPLDLNLLAIQRGEETDALETETFASEPAEETNPVSLINLENIA